MYKFSKISTERLNTCHPDLQKLFNEVIKIADCTIICGHRTEQEQQFVYEQGFSLLRFPDSNHNKVPSLAVDVMPYPVNWTDYKRVHHFAGIVKGIAHSLKIGIVWGGDWRNFHDLPHYELKGAKDEPI